MASRQGASLDRKKLMADPIMVTTIVVLITFLTLFILYPLAILLVDSVYSKDSGITLSIFQRIFGMSSFRTAITNTLKVGFTVGIFSTLIGLLFAYVEVYVKVRTKFMGGLFRPFRPYYFIWLKSLETVTTYSMGLLRRYRFSQ